MTHVSDIAACVRYDGDERIVAQIRERRITYIRHEPLEEKTCPVCDSSFVGIGRKTFCSVRCANKASYRRHAERRREEKRAYRRQHAASGRAAL